MGGPWQPGVMMQYLPVQISMCTHRLFSNGSEVIAGSCNASWPRLHMHLSEARNGYPATYSASLYSCSGARAPSTRRVGYSTAATSSHRGQEALAAAAAAAWRPLGACGRGRLAGSARVAAPGGPCAADQLARLRVLACGTQRWGGGAAQSERLDHLYRKQSCTAVAAPIGQFESDVHSPWLRQPPGGMAGPTSSAGSAAAGGPCASSYQLPPAAATAVGECLLAAALHLLALPAAPLGGDGERGCWPPVCCCCCSCGGLCWPPGLALAETVTETGM